MPPAHRPASACRQIYRVGGNRRAAACRTSSWDSWVARSTVLATPRRGRFGQEVRLGWAIRLLAVWPNVGWWSSVVGCARRDERSSRPASSLRRRRRGAVCLAPLVHHHNRSARGAESKIHLGRAGHGHFGVLRYDATQGTQHADHDRDARTGATTVLSTGVCWLSIKPSGKLPARNRVQASRTSRYDSRLEPLPACRSAVISAGRGKRQHGCTHIPR